MHELVLIGVLMLFGSVLQGVAGFGFTLFSLPLLLAGGLGLVEAVTLCILGSTTQKIVAVYHLRSDVDWRVLIPMIVAGIAALPLGVYLMREISFLKSSLIRQIVGALILLSLAFQWFGKIRTRNALAKGWGYLAGFFGGLLTGLANIGGPPIVLWILAHRWSNEKMRVMALAFLLGLVPFQAVMLLSVFGKPILHAAGKGLVLIPVLLLGVWLGLRLGAKLRSKHVRLLMQLLLLIISLNAILRPFFAK